MKFHIVTPSLTASPAIEYMVASLARQSALAHNQHSICYSIRIADGEPLPFSLSKVPGLKISVTSESDDGLYSALEKGFAEEANEADVFCYLGVGDYLAPHALEIVAECMAAGAQWLTGYICSYNSRHHMVEAQVPFRYRRALLQAGVYGRRLPYVQQESTFWNQYLHRQINWDAVIALRYAGDAMLWRQFAQYAPLRVVEAWLGGFERTEGQLSQVHRQEYLFELQKISDPLTLSHRLQTWCDWCIWHAPRKVKRHFDTGRFIYCHQSQRYMANSELPD